MYVIPSFIQIKNSAITDLENFVDLARNSVTEVICRLEPSGAQKGSPYLLNQIL